MVPLDIAARRYEFPSGRGALRVEHHRGSPGFLYHYHPEHELALIRGSAGKRIVGDSVAEYVDRDLVLVGPNLAHSWAFEPLPAGGRAVDHVVIAFTPETIGLDLLERPELAGARKLLRRSERGIEFGEATIAGAEPAIEALRKRRGLGRLAGFLGLLDLLARARDARAVASRGYEPSRIERDHGLFREALEFIHRGSAGRLRLEDAAGHLGMSVPTFVRFFKRMTGKTFVGYLNSWRIGRARTLLLETDMKVAEVAGSVGFENLSHFNRLFRRLSGATPSGLRSRPGASR